MGTGSHIPPSIGMGHKLNTSRGELLCSRRMRYLNLFAGEKAGGGGGLLLLSLLQGVRVLVYQHSARQSGRDAVVEILERGWCPPTMTVTGRCSWPRPRPPDGEEAGKLRVYAVADEQGGVWMRLLPGGLQRMV